MNSNSLVNAVFDYREDVFLALKSRESNIRKTQVEFKYLSINNINLIPSSLSSSVSLLRR